MGERRWKGKQISPNKYQVRLVGTDEYTKIVGSKKEGIKYKNQMNTQLDSLAQVKETDDLIKQRENLVNRKGELDNTYDEGGEDDKSSVKIKKIIDQRIADIDARLDEYHPSSKSTRTTSTETPKEKVKKRGWWGKAIDKSKFINKRKAELAAEYRSILKAGGELPPGVNPSQITLDAKRKATKEWEEKQSNPIDLDIR